jgi:hypothetical protein
MTAAGRLTLTSGAPRSLLPGPRDHPPPVAPATQILAAAEVGWPASSRARPLQDTVRPAGRRRVGSGVGSGEAPAQRSVADPARAARMRLGWAGWGGSPGGEFCRGWSLVFEYEFAECKQPCRCDTEQCSRNCESEPLRCAGPATPAARSRPCSASVAMPRWIRHCAANCHQSGRAAPMPRMRCGRRRGNYARTTTAACGSTCCKAPIYIEGSRAGFARQRRSRLSRSDQELGKSRTWVVGSRGRIRTFVESSKVTSPAWLDDPGSRPAATLPGFRSTAPARELGCRASRHRVRMDYAPQRVSSSETDQSATQRSVIDY